MYSALEKAMDGLSNAIMSIGCSPNSNVDLGTPVIGSSVGVCKNCGANVIIRQPWMSTRPVVNDGWYIFHCSDEECHNCTGMEVRLNELGYLDFIEWDPKYIKKEVAESTIESSAKIIDITKYFNRKDR